jgi:glycosyltransferase involved in cell wall biosynthesis
MSDDFQPLQRPVRVLHSVGHLLRGGIEKWLFQTLPPQLSGNCEHHIMVRTNEEEAFTSAFREAGLPVLVCANFTNPIRYALEFKNLVQEHGPYDILHVHGSSFTGLLALALARSAGIRTTVVHSHDDVRPVLVNRGWLYRSYVAATLWAYRAMADFGFAASTLAAESMFGDRWVKDSRWQLLYCGVDCKPFNKPRDPFLRTRLGIPENSFVIGHVGRYCLQKNHAFVLEIVEATLAQRPDVHCLLIGEGHLRAKIMTDIERRGLKGHFTFVPDTPVISDYMMSAMDCFVFPSLHEGLGLVAIEAQAAGLPCLISDRVPAEAIVDPSLVDVLALEQPASEWASTILAIRSAAQKAADPATVTKVENSLFNLDHCISSLQLRYLQLASR